MATFLCHINDKQGHVCVHTCALSCARPHTRTHLHFVSNEKGTGTRTPNYQLPVFDHLSERTETVQKEVHAHSTHRLVPDT